MCSGVLKSGSPKLRSITSIPFDLNSRPSLAIFSVSGSLNLFKRGDNCMGKNFGRKCKAKRRPIGTSFYCFTHNFKRVYFFDNGPLKTIVYRQLKKGDSERECR